MIRSILISEAEIQAKLDEIAARIRKDYGDRPILLVAVLKGSFLVVSDLCRRLGDNVTVDFVQISSYGNGRKSSGNIQIRKDLDINIEGLDVLIVEDIVDSGQTLDHLLSILRTRNPNSLRVFALLSKPSARIAHVPLDYVGFEIPEEFVVGYGLDFAERFRNLRDIAILSEDDSSFAR
jgi:hypoxanthine phosphoribosyltransferase